MGRGAGSSAGTPKGRDAERRHSSRGVVGGVRCACCASLGVGSGEGMEVLLAWGDRVVSLRIGRLLKIADFVSNSRSSASGV